MSAPVAGPPRAALRAVERREAQAFDHLAERADRSRLTTPADTFRRYRLASLGQPLARIYPDLVFVRLGERLGRRSDPRRPLAGLRVLDLGAGDGAWSVILAEQGAAVTALEISPRQAALARERMERHGLSWDLRVGSAFALGETFAAGAFDLVFGLAVLHHLTQDLPAVFAGVRRVLRPGGLGVFLEPYCGSAGARRVRERLARFVPPDRESPDERPLTPEDLAALGDGFAAVEVEHLDLLARLARRLARSRRLERGLAACDRLLLRSRRLRALAGRIFLAVTR